MDPLLQLVTEHGRIRLTLTASFGTLGSVEAIHPSGETRPVRNFTQISMSDGIAVGWDYEMPIGRAMIYRAMIYDPSDLINPLATVDSAPITWVTDYDWLKAPFHPARNQAVSVSSMPSYDYATPVSVHQVINRADPVAIGQVRQGATGTLILNTYTLAQNLAMQLILSGGDPLLFQSTVESGVGNLYMMVTDSNESRVSPLRDAPERIWTLTYQEIGIPAGDAGAFASYADLLAAQPDYASVLAAWASYIDLFTTLNHADTTDTIIWRGA